MNQYEISEVVRKHSVWLKGELGGERADLSGCDCYEANLANTNLHMAALCRTCLIAADLRHSDLSFANLAGAKLFAADLRGADLSSADLSGADLGGANLQGANLYNVNLRGAIGRQFITFDLGHHEAIFTYDEGFIGCERHSHDVWINSFREIGKKHGYWDDDIEVYGKFIRSAVEIMAERKKESQSEYQE